MPPTEAFATAPPKIRLRAVSKQFDVRTRAPRAARRAAPFLALHDVNLDVEAGQFLTLVGPSGCGKSTLLDLLGGLTAPSAGDIWIDGRPVAGPGLDRSIVFQQYALFPWRTALGNIEFGLEAKGVPKSERPDRARQYLALVGLQKFAEHYPHELSGGMKQRVAIARSLSYDPDILLMDEPFGALDEQTRESLQEELLNIWRGTGKTIVFITHSIDEAVYLGQRVAVMQAGPGRITDIVAGPATARPPGQDVRAEPEFVALRHEVWKLLRRNTGSTQTPLH
ncbi:MAG: ABC transporter ATP-binding protein [Xenophilus sp.]